MSSATLRDNPKSQICSEKRSAQIDKCTRLETAVAVDKNVGGLEIAMDNVVPVQISVGSNAAQLGNESASAAERT